jgi:competence CoiA-like predicted nuclease
VRVAKRKKVESVIRLPVSIFCYHPKEGDGFFMETINQSKLEPNCLTMRCPKCKKEVVVRIGR